jgi:CheY-like chemotaxis protein
VAAACDKPNTFQFLTPPGTPIAQQIEAIATRIYGAAGVDLESQAKKDLERIEKLGLGTAPVCMAKSHLSLSHDPNLRNRPGGFTLPVRALVPSAGAGSWWRCAARCSGIAGAGQDAGVPQHRHRRERKHGRAVLEARGERPEATAMSSIRVMLAGDCPLLRGGFRQVLEAAGMTVVGSVDSAADAAALLQTTAADVIVVGTVTSHGSGADAAKSARRIRRFRCSSSAAPATRTACARRSAPARAATSGSKGPPTATSFRPCEVSRPARCISAQSSPRRRRRRRRPGGAAPAAGGSAHRARAAGADCSVLAGASNREIARVLGLSANTIRRSIAPIS